MINPLWLKTFCTLADIGHFTQTAELLFMTQSGVSQHIKKLEQQLNTPLLIRRGKSFSLTDAGIKLHRQGQDLLYALEELSSAIKQDEPLVGTVRIASPGSIGLKLYPHLLKIQQQHTKLIIDHTFAPNSQIEQDLLDRKIEIGLVTEQTKTPDLISKKIANESLVLITSKKHQSVTWGKLIQLGYIDHPDGAHHAQQLLSRNFGEFTHIEQFVHKGFSNQISLILEPVSRDLGFTVLPLHAVKAFHHQGQINTHTLSNSFSESLFLCKNSRAFETQRSQFIQSAIVDFI
jgi:DNA-binding transcriptional LysR family regulator